MKSAAVGTEMEVEFGLSPGLLHNFLLQSESI